MMGRTWVLIVLYGSSSVLPISQSEEIFFIENKKKSDKKANRNRLLVDNSLEIEG